MSVELNKWYMINASCRDTTEVMYLGCVGLVRSIVYDSNMGDPISTSIIKIDHQSAFEIAKSTIKENEK